MLEERLTDEILRLFYKVHHELGFGFLERVYKNALYMELLEAGIVCETEKEIDVYYKDRVVGKFYADIIVEDCVILELKAVKSLCLEHECQLINYLKATRQEVGLLLNFGVKPEFKRKIFTNNRKNNPCIPCIPCAKNDE